MTLTYSEVAEIVKIIDSSNCEEVSLELEGAKILIRRKGATALAPVPAQTAMPSQKLDNGAASGVARPEPAPSHSVAAPEEGDRVCAPMVGTFYTRPSPDEPEFVSVGSKVTSGMPLCIIEVMKLFTTIEAKREGTIKAILAADGEMVEYGQPLFVFE